MVIANFQLMPLNIWFNLITETINIFEGKTKKIHQDTHKLQMSISGPYFSEGLKSSGAAYSGDPQWVFIRLSLENVLLRPKSVKERKRKDIQNKMMLYTYVEKRKSDREEEKRMQLGH